MDILKQFEGKINGTLETFDRIIIDGYLQQLHSFRLFLYYLIQKHVLLKDFQSIASQQTAALCNHIESYIQEQGCEFSSLCLQTIRNTCPVKKLPCLTHASFPVMVHHGYFDTYRQFPFTCYTRIAE